MALPAGSYGGLRGRSPEELPTWVLLVASGLFVAGVAWLRLRR
jgi:hypothetical protein